MKKTLIIAPEYPVLEKDGASMRTMNFVRYFKNLGEVDMLCKNHYDQGHLCYSIFGRQYFIDSLIGEENKVSRFTRITDKLLRLKTWSTNHYTPESELAITNLLVEGNYDFVLCRYLNQAYPLLKLDDRLKSKVILDVDDIVTDTIYDAETEGVTGINILKTKLDKHVLKLYQKKCMCFGSIIFCSIPDKLKSASPAQLYKAHVVPNVFNGMTLPEGYSEDGYDKANHLFFVGSLKYLPNTQGIFWFIKELFPKVLEQFPDSTLSVVGRNPPDELVNLISRCHGIELYANVPDIAPFYEKCGISVVPLLAGGGTRIKILESGFAKRPVMSTEIGAYGLGTRDGEDVMIFNDSQSFLDKYRKLREDREFYRVMTDKLFRFVHRNYSQDNFNKAMDLVVKPLL